MVEAAVADVPGLVAGRLEIDHGGNSYTADTLEALGEQFPEAELYTIVGDDAAAVYARGRDTTRSWRPRGSW